MNKKTPYKVAFVRPQKHCSERVQKKAALEWGVDEEDITTHGRSNENIAVFLDKVRHGDWVAVYSVDLFVARGKSLASPRRPALRKVVDKLFNKGVVVFELKTGRSCKSRHELVAMYDDAIRKLAGERNQQAGPGRPAKHNYTDEQKADIQTIWNDKRLKNNAERELAVQQKYPQVNMAAYYKFIR